MQPTTPTPTRSAASVILDTLIIVSPISFLIFPLTEELHSTLCIVLRALGLILCFTSRCVSFTTTIPEGIRHVWVFPTQLIYSYTTLHIQWVVFPINTSLQQVCINIIGVVPEYFIPLTDLEILIAAPPFFFFIEALFYSVITYESSDDLGFFGQFYQGLWLIYTKGDSFNNIILLWTHSWSRFVEPTYPGFVGTTYSTKSTSPWFCECSSFHSF